MSAVYIGGGVDILQELLSIYHHIYFIISYLYLKAYYLYAFLTDLIFFKTKNGFSLYLSFISVAITAFWA